MKNICILADSLGSERPDGIDAKDRWPKLLESEFHEYEIKNNSRSLSTTQRLYELNKDNSNFFIIQLGIVDCAPRIFHKIESKLISRLPTFLLSLVVKKAKKHRKYCSSRAYVNLESFKKNIVSFVEQKNNSRIIYIKILPPSKMLINKNPTIGNSIEKYNAVIDSIEMNYANFSTVSIEMNLIDDITLDDGYHLNGKGHRFIFEEIKRKLKSLST